ncbi:unnamed protein product [Symbiodinium sp. CCMP2592]|nr:unnamed protein product [Symbiodinium sp. CCMP2592]
MAETDAQAYLHNSLREWLPYLVIHATLARVRYQQPVLAVKTLPAESTGLAHANYAVSWTMAFLSGLTDFSLDGTGGPLLAMARSPDEVPPPPRVGPLVKLRGLERVAFDCVLYYQGYAADSPLAQLLNLPPPPRWWPQKAARFLAALEARFGPTDDKALLILFWFVRRAVSWLGALAVGLLLVAVSSALFSERDGSHSLDHVTGEQSFKLPGEGEAGREVKKGFKKKKGAAAGAAKANGTPASHATVPCMQEEEEEEDEPEEDEADEATVVTWEPDEHFRRPADECTDEEEEPDEADEDDEGEEEEDGQEDCQTCLYQASS